MFNEAQQKAIYFKDGQLIIVACPGSGKTTVIVERTNQLIEAGVNPANILVVTFTNQAANDMKARYEKKFGKTNVLFGTIHSLCYRVLAKTYGYTREDILSPVEQYDFFRRQATERKIQISDMETFLKSLLTEISCVRNSEIPLHKFESEAAPKDFQSLFLAYEDYKKSLGKVDFDDMIISCKKVFETMPEELAYWRKQFSYIMIDEFQDTNKIQADIFYMLSSLTGNICIVGDDDQSIYRFRAANSDIMLNFPKVFKNAEICELSTNYRSQPVIIKHASKLIEHNSKRFKKEFKSSREQTDGYVKCIPLETINAQTDAVINAIEQYRENGLDYNEMAVLYRTNSQNQLLLGKLLAEKVPFFTTEPPKDYHAEFIFGDIMAYARLAQGNYRKGDIQRILNRPGRYLKAEPFKECSFSKGSLYGACDKLPVEQRARAKAIISEICHDIQHLGTITNPEMFVKHLGYVMGYRAWLEGYAEFCRKDPDAVKNLFDTLLEESKGFSTMQEWQEYADFYAQELEKKRRDRKKDGVCLSTFHSAKGLEWKAVIIIDCNEGVCPAKQAETTEDFEEERRAFYVAATRAKDYLRLFYVKNNGDKNKSKSRYLDEMGF